MPSRNNSRSVDKGLLLFLKEKVSEKLLSRERGQV